MNEALQLFVLYLRDRPRVPTVHWTSVKAQKTSTLNLIINGPLPVCVSGRSGSRCRALELVILGDMYISIFDISLEQWSATETARVPAKRT